MRSTAWLGYLWKQSAGGALYLRDGREVAMGLAALRATGQSAAVVNHAENPPFTSPTPKCRWPNEGRARTMKTEEG